MPSYIAPVRDMGFILHELLKIDRYSEVMAGFADANAETIDAILEGAARISQELLLPINTSGDQEGCQWQNGQVITPRGFKEAYHSLVEGEWTSLTGNPQYGGQGLPYVLGLAVSEMMASANMAFTMYPGLTTGAIEAIEIDGSEAQKALFLPKMIAGHWTGTMNLTEPHCGTDLGLLRTKAEPQADGSYRLTGTKIFISAGEHDLAENIIHLVLARIPDAPEGINGISLFIVPKFSVSADGTCAAQVNGVQCSAIEHKMGIHGNATCVMNYDGAIGQLLGEQHKGLRTMFIMMNAARLAVAVQGLSQSEAAYQNAVAYCKQRLQGRSLRGAQYPEQAADPIIVHPDIRRMLMTVRVFNEGARALAYWAGLTVDIIRKHPDAETRRKADDLLGLLTPVLKAYFTDMGFNSANLCLQCFGGYGYITESGMEQFVRDARITQIYEGANGIQALDLIGRKLSANKGRAVQLFFTVAGGFCKKYQDNASLSPFVKPLSEALQRLVEATQWLMRHGISNQENAGAASMDYLYLMALVALGYQWAQVARICQNQLSNPDDNSFDREFYQHKLVCAGFFMEKVLPETASHLMKIQSGADLVMALPAEAF